MILEKVHILLSTTHFIFPQQPSPGNRKELRYRMLQNCKIPLCYLQREYALRVSWRIHVNIYIVAPKLSTFFYFSLFSIGQIRIDTKIPIPATPAYSYHQYTFSERGNLCCAIWIYSTSSETRTEGYNQKLIAHLCSVWLSCTGTSRSDSR